MLRPYTYFNRHTIDPEVTTKIRLHQHTHGPATDLRRELPARRPDPAFPPERHGPTARTYCAFGNRAGGGTANGAQDVSLGDRPRADVVQKAVIRLTHHRIRRTHVFVARQRKQPREHRIGGARHAQGAGQDDRRLELAELIHLRRAGELAKTVPDDNRGRDLLPERIATVRED